MSTTTAPSSTSQAGTNRAPASNVALVFAPLVVPVEPTMTMALAKLSLVGWAKRLNAEKTSKAATG